MIVFTTLKNIPREYLDMKGIRQVVKFNLSSYFSGEDITILDKLIPIGMIPDDVVTGNSTSPEFDRYYSNYIFQNQNAFFQFMNIIVYEYMDPSVLVQVLINTDGIREAISESLMKLIQQRYGMSSFYVFTPEDFMYINVPEVGVSIPGLFTLDQDLAQYRNMLPMDPGDMYE